MKGYKVGIHVGATSMRVGLFNEKTELVSHRRTLTDCDAEVGRFFDLIERLTRELVAENGIAMEDLAGIGIAFPSSIDHTNGYIIETNSMLYLRNIPARELLEKRFHLPVCIDNDSNAFALAEHELGAGVGFDHMIYVTLATGIGGGIIINGRLFRGMHGMAGEIGHMLVSDSQGFPCSCGVMGCVQSISSGRYMAKYALERIKEGEDSAILEHAGTFANIDMLAVGRAYRVRDPLAVEIVERGADYLGRMFRSLNQIFDINVFVCGGGVTKLGESFTDRIISTYRHYSPMDERYPARFLPAKLGELGGIYGAALLIEEA